MTEDNNNLFHNNNSFNDIPATTSIRYRLIAQYRHDELLLEILGQNLFMRRTAREVMRTPELLNGLSPEHAAYVGLAAGMALWK